MRTVPQHLPPVSSTRRLTARCAVTAVAMLLGATLRTATTLAAADPQGDYAALFGEEEKKVMSTPNTRDDAAFAAKLLAKAAELKDAPELQRFVYARAMLLGQKDPEGIDTAVEAGKLLVSTASAADKATWQAKLIDIYGQQYRRASGQKRVEAGEFLLTVLVQEADSLASQGKYTESAKRMKEGQAIAQTIRSSRADELASLLKEIQGKQSTVERLEKLRTRLDTQGGDLKALEQVILGYLLDLDDYATARKFAVSHPDQSWAKMVEASAKKQSDLSEADSLELARWYAKLLNSALPASKPAAYGRAARLYRQVLEAHVKQDSLRLQTQSELAALEKGWRGPGLVADNVVIWNTHNANYNDRGSSAGLLVLIYKGRVVWRSAELQLKWATGKDLSTAVPLPPVLFDAVRVEIKKWNGTGAGLSEIEVFQRDSNVAGTARVEASGTWSNQFPAATLVDGRANSDTFGKCYWLAPDRTEAWVELRFTSRTP